MYMIIVQKSSLLQLKGKLFIILFILFIPFVYGLKLGSSNSKLFFNTSVNSETCKRLVIGSSYIGVIENKILFSKNDTREIKDYITPPEKLGIKLKYEKEINFEIAQNKEIEICVNPSKSGKYYGILNVKPKEGNLKLGVWIFIDAIEDNKKEIILLLTPSIFLGLLLLILIKSKKTF